MDEPCDSNHILPKTEPTSSITYHSPPSLAQQQQQRWRLILGRESRLTFNATTPWTERDGAIDQALAMLYDGDRASSQDESGDRQGSLEGMSTVTRWLGDIRTYFPASVVQVMQRDALERFDWYQLLADPSALELIEPDVYLVANILASAQIMPTAKKEAARQVVQKLVTSLLAKLMIPMQQVVRGSLHRARQTRHPCHHAINWDRTIRANLRHYQPNYRTIIPDVFIGYEQRRSTLKHIILCVDQSGSMLPSVVYASIFAAVLASIPALTTTLVLFDTAVVDVSDRVHDPVALLLGSQLGGGTDINRALNYCQTLIRQPEDTTLILISDLYEGGNPDSLVKQMGTIVASGVQAIALLALSDMGTPSFNPAMASQFAALGIPSFGCTPDQFPALMATALNRGDIYQWASRQNIEVVA